MLKTIVDFLPVVVFFLAYFLPGGDIYRATLAMMITVPIQLIVGYVSTRTINKMHLVSAGLLMVFGSAALLLKNDLIIKWKPTVLDWLFAAAFLGTQLFTGKPLVERVAGEALTLPAKVWAQLNYAWVAFWFVMGALNLLVVYNFSEAFWVNFKLFGTMGLMLLFMILQGLWLRQYLPEDAEEES